MPTENRSTGSSAVDRSRPPSPGPLRPYDFPTVERSALSSDVPLLSARVDDFPVVTVHLLLPAGGVSEDPRLGGLASLTCALLDSGTRKRSASDLAEAIESLGVDLDAGASWDAAYLSLTALRSRLEPALDLLAELILEPTFPDTEVDRVRAQRIAEIVQRRSDPRALATEAIARFIHADQSPFSRALGGVISTVERITRSDLVGFHASRFRPGGATVVAAGDVDPTELSTLLDQR
jgi:zinc protease